MESRTNNSALFSSALWQRALENYASVVHLTVELFDAEGHLAFGPIHPTPLFRLFEETPAYHPGLFEECVRRCLARTEGRAPVMVSEFCGLTVIGTALTLNDKIVGAAVAGYSFMDFCRVSEVQRLALNSGIGFDHLWQLIRELRPTSKQRLLVNAELLQILGDAMLKENLRTRQYREALHGSETRLRGLAAQTIASQEDERRQVARELHDNICQKLVVLEMDAHQLEPKIASDPGGATYDLQQLRNRIRILAEEVRDISHSVHSSIIDELGLVPALRSLLEDFRRHENVRVTFMPHDVPDGIPDETATGLYRIAQEALQNVAKHAGKTHVKVILRGHAGGVRLTIEDAGPGFDTRARRSGLGLTSMEERARMMQGSFRIESGIGKGTRVSVYVPLEAGASGRKRAQAGASGRKRAQAGASEGSRRKRRRHRRSIDGVYDGQ